MWHFRDLHATMVIGKIIFFYFNSIQDDVCGPAVWRRTDGLMHSPSKMIQLTKGERNELIIHACWWWWKGRDMRRDQKCNWDKAHAIFSTI